MKIQKGEEEGDVFGAEIIPDSREGSPAEDGETAGLGQDKTSDAIQEAPEDFDKSFDSMFEEMDRTQSQSGSSIPARRVFDLHIITK